MAIKAILFDKDGTLFDFAATWNGWAARMLKRLSAGEGDREQAMAASIRYDLVRGKFYPDSPVIAGSNLEVAELFSRHLPGRDVHEIERELAEAAAQADLAEAVPLPAFLDGLLARGLPLGVMTNDAELSARSQLRRAGILDRFVFVAGFDSGHGVKPDPAPLLAFCRTAGVAPREALMVGDSLHDLKAGRAAGMHTVGVLTGMALVRELDPFADAVLPDIGHIPDWLGR